ncbi:MAG: hypothetical protein AVDCRST_MAG68-3249, partial [uncultured Gemmatimonadetes bacterium]
PPPRAQLRAATRHLRRAPLRRLCRSDAQPLRRSAPKCL